MVYLSLSFYFYSSCVCIFKMGFLQTTYILCFDLLWKFLLTGAFRQLTFKATSDIVGLLFTLFVTVFYLLPLFFVPVFLFHLFCLSWFKLVILYESVFLASVAYLLCFFCKVFFNDCPRVRNIDLQLSQVNLQVTLHYLMGSASTL